MNKEEILDLYEDHQEDEVLFMKVSADHDKIRTGGVVAHAQLICPPAVGGQLVISAAPVDESVGLNRLVNTSPIKGIDLEWEDGEVYSILLHTETGSIYRLVQRGLHVREDRDT